MSILNLISRLEQPVYKDQKGDAVPLMISQAKQHTWERPVRLEIRAAWSSHTPVFPLSDRVVHRAACDASAVILIWHVPQ